MLAAARCVRLESTPSRFCLPDPDDSDVAGHLITDKLPIAKVNLGFRIYGLGGEPNLDRAYMNWALRGVGRRE